MQLNAQSILTKIDELRLLMNDTLPDVLCISESWLNQKIPDEFIGIQDYLAIRLDRRTGKRGGGLITLMKIYLKVLMVLNIPIY